MCRHATGSFNHTFAPSNLVKCHKHGKLGGGLFANINTQQNSVPFHAQNLLFLSGIVDAK